MPHITIEYSANVAEHHDIDALVRAVHEAAIDHGLPSPGSLRTRAVSRVHYRVADGSDDLAFVAIAVRVGPGRDAETKTGFIETLLDVAESQVGSEPGPLAIAWSIELGEIDADFRINRNYVRSRIAERADAHGGAT